MKTTKEKILLCLCILLFMGVCTMGLLYRKAENQRQLLSVSLQDSVRILTTKKGEVISRFNASEIERANLKEALQRMEVDFKKLKDENISWRDLTEVLRMKLEVSGRDTIILYDTIYQNKTIPVPVGAKSFNWTNGYLHEWGMVRNNQIDRSYRYDVYIDHKVEKRNGQSIVTLSVSDQKNARIVKGQEIIIKPTQRWWKNKWIWMGLSFGTGFYLGSK